MSERRASFEKDNASTRQPFRGRLIRLGQRAKNRPRRCAGVVAAACTQRECTQHGKPHGVVRDDQPDAREGQAGRHGGEVRNTERTKNKIFACNREITRLKELWNEGVTLEAIAAELYCSPDGSGGDRRRGIGRRGVEVRGRKVCCRQQLPPQKLRRLCVPVLLSRLDDRERAVDQPFAAGELRHANEIEQIR